MLFSQFKVKKKRSVIKRDNLVFNKAHNMK